eukprot:3941925-Rhodomonas_salina.9
MNGPGWVQPVKPHSSPGSGPRLRISTLRRSPGCALMSDPGTTPLALIHRGADLGSLDGDRAGEIVDL